MEDKHSGIVLWKTTGFAAMYPLKIPEDPLNIVKNNMIMYYDVKAPQRSDLSNAIFSRTFMSKLRMMQNRDSNYVKSQGTKLGTTTGNMGVIDVYKVPMIWPPIVFRTSSHPGTMGPIGSMGRMYIYLHLPNKSM